MRDSSAFSVCILFEESVFIFQFLDDKMHNYVKHLQENLAFSLCILLKENEFVFYF